MNESQTILRACSETERHTFACNDCYEEHIFRGGCTDDFVPDLVTALMTDGTYRCAKHAPAQMAVSRIDDRQQQWERLKAIPDQDARSVLCRLWGFLGRAEHLERDAQSAKDLLDKLSEWVEQEGRIRG